MKKNVFLAKTLSRIGLFVLMISIFGLFTECKRSEDDPYKDVTVQFKVKSSSDVTIKAAVSQVGTEQSIQYTVPGTTWQSEPRLVNTSVGAVYLSATGNGVDSTSELTVSILIDGQVKKTQTVNGVNLTAKTMLNFLTNNN